MAEVVDFDRLVISAKIPLSEAAALKPGQTAQVQDETSDTLETGTLSYVSKEVDNRSGTLSVQISLPVDTPLRSGQFVSLRIATEEHKDRLAVPLASLVKNTEGESVIAIVENDIARQRVVQVGLREDNWVEVAEDGLKEGMVVVTDGAYALPEETRVRLLVE
jgi:RND family efflux transporter MFP subunit